MHHTTIKTEWLDNIDFYISKKYKFKFWKNINLYIKVTHIKIVTTIITRFQGNTKIIIKVRIVSRKTTASGCSS